MKLAADARLVLRKAWSIKFSVAAGLFAAAEVVVPLYADALPHGTFAVLAGLSSFGALVSRVLAQKEFSDGSS